MTTQFTDTNVQNGYSRQDCEDGLLLARAQLSEAKSVVILLEKEIKRMKQELEQGGINE